MKKISLVFILVFCFVAGSFAAEEEFLWSFEKKGKWKASAKADPEENGGKTFEQPSSPAASPSHGKETKENEGREDEASALPDPDSAALPAPVELEEELPLEAPLPVLPEEDLPRLLPNVAREGGQASLLPNVAREGGQAVDSMPALEELNIDAEPIEVEEVKEEAPTPETRNQEPSLPAGAGTKNETATGSKTDFDWTWGDKKRAEGGDLKPEERAEGGDPPRRASLKPSTAGKPEVKEVGKEKQDSSLATKQPNNQTTVSKTEEDALAKAKKEEKAKQAALAKAQAAEREKARALAKAKEHQDKNQELKAQSKEQQRIYAELVQENLDLRKKVTSAEDNQQAVKSENKKLSRQTTDLEKKITESVMVINRLKSEKDNQAQNLDKMKELEDRLAEAERQKGEFSQKLDKLIAEAKEKAAAKPEPKPEPVPTTPRPGSDLFMELQKKNAMLKDKLVDIETQRQRAVKAQGEILSESEDAQKDREKALAKQKDLERQLADAKSSEKAQKKNVDKLFKKIPALEKELEKLKGSSSENKAALDAKEKEIETLKSAILEREKRWIKAERMEEILEGARAKIRKDNNKEMRDMHYNLAAIAARDGKFKEAEKEYLRALRIDPNDAGVHYNLAIIYEENLEKNSKALLHYKKYLKLNPFAADADQVRTWIINLEMK